MSIISEASVWGKITRRLSLLSWRLGMESPVERKKGVTWDYTPAVLGGKVKFVVEGMESKEVTSDYMIVTEASAAQVETIASDMAGRWHLRTPKLILSVISNVSYFRSWKRVQDVEDFEDGLMEAACLTDMWIITEGMNSGVSAMIGNAIAREKSRRSILVTEQTMVRFLSSEPLTTLTVMGVVSGNCLKDSQMMELQNAATTKHPMTIRMSETDDDYAQLNPNLTHFFIINDNLPPSACAHFRFLLESRFLQPVGKERRYMHEDQGEAGTESLRTPLIGLMIQGGPEEIDHVLTLLRRQVPVIVICGQGKAADLLAFALKAALETADPENYRTYIKTELLRQMTEMFPDEFRDNSEARNQCRDRILQCVTHATEGGANLVTLVERNVQGFELKDLSKVILTAVLASHDARPVQSGLEQIQWNLQLTIDWKRPDLAQTEIFNKNNLTKFVVGEEQFEQVLLAPGREEFVELFLEWGFVLHKYLNHRRLEVLYERCHDKEFFAGICLETILGEKMTLQRPLPEQFLDRNDCVLNRLLEILTGLHHLINPLLLSLNSGVDRIDSIGVAEERALHAVLYWAALTNNAKLTRILWSQTNEPLAMALVLSTLHSRLARHWIWDHDLKLKMKKIGVDYGQLAVQLLDLNYRESTVKALNSVTTKLPDFKNFTAVDLAVMGHNKYFLAHPCCQKYINNLWYGQIRVRHGKAGFFSLPDIVKIYLSLLLILPSYLWIDLVQDSRRETGQSQRAGGQKSACCAASLCCRCILPQKLYYMWTAPVTKYWTAQLMQTCFLILFGYSLCLPLCGQYELNLLSSFWLVTLIFEQLYVIVAKKSHSSENRIAGNIHNLTVITYTLSLEVVFRVLQFTYLSFAQVKTLLSFSLIYLFYNAMGYFFPVSQTLGPMLVNITVMMRQDLVKWLKILSMTLASGAVTISAVLYPARTLGVNTVFKSMLRGILGLFMTDVGDLKGESCSCLYNHTLQYGCRVSEIPEDVKHALEECPYSSPGGYFIVLQYIFHVKLVYNTLIFAICSVTMNRTYEKSIEIWKYQFFMLVLGFKRRPCLPAPLMVLMYPYILCSCCFHTALRFYRTYCPCCPRRHEKGKPLPSYNMWKVFIKNLKKQEKIKQDSLNVDKYREERLRTLRRDQTTQRKLIDSLNDRMMEVLNSQTSAFLMMERMQHVLDGIATKTQTLGEVVAQRAIHSNCRKSPYPSTSLRRFAVFDKNIPWEEAYPNYDPATYTRPVEEFDEEIRPFVDPDLFELLKQKEERDRLGSDEHEDLDAIPMFTPQFNGSVRSQLPNGEAYYIDRTSWITKDNQNLQYLLDLKGAPRNPMGRTGLQGRGNLWRWGPNHMMYAIISRWRSVYNSAGVVQGPMYINGKRVMEVMVIHNELIHEDSLPGGFVTGRTSRYSAMCEMFMRDLLGETVPGSETLDQEDMSQFFRQFVSSDFILSGILGRSIAASSSFSSQLLYRGYIDDIYNTDNAWVEAEVWSFHYHSKDKFDKKVPQREKHWREVSTLMQLANDQLPFVLEVARLYDESS